MTEELSLNDDPDSLMIEETSTLGLPNISDITRFQIELENSSSGKYKNYKFLTKGIFSVLLCRFLGWFVLLGSAQDKCSNFRPVHQFSPAHSHLQYY